MGSYLFPFLTNLSRLVKVKVAYTVVHIVITYLGWVNRGCVFVQHALGVSQHMVGFNLEVRD